jgi:hypothetical protein
MRGLCAPTAPTARVASARALRGRGARRSPPLRAVSPRAQAASWGGDEGNKDEWRAHGKQIVEALTRGSSLARAASVWFVDRRADDGASTSAAAAPASFATPGEIQRFGARTDDAADDVLRVDARRESLPRRALAHPESRENREVRAALERHLASGGATVLLAPIVDPLIVDLSADADRDAAATFDEACGCSSDDPNCCCCSAPATAACDPNDGATRSGSVSSGSFVRFDATWKNGDERDVFVEGTACACDPNDPGDCCARGLSEYCTTCPTLASCDESLDGLGSDGLTAGSSVDRDPSPLRSTDALESLEALHAACAAATRTGDCAFSEAIKDEVSRKGERPENAGRTYYAAVVRTRDVGRSDDALQKVESAWNEDASAFSAAALANAGYEQFLVYRPNGDAWIAGSVPPPTTVRRASFGPKLRAELWSLAKRGGR